MKKVIILIVCAFCLSFSTTIEASAANAETTTQVAPKKKAAKGSVKKKAIAKKYVPASYGDCYIGNRSVKGGPGVWCELTFYPNGKCELKMDDAKPLSGTFIGTRNGNRMKIAVKFSNDEEYDFTGTNEHITADDGIVKYDMSIEF